MELFYIRIGDFFIQINSHSIYTLNRFGDFEMILDTPISPDMIIELKDGFGVCFVNFDVTITQNEGKVCYHRADYLIEVDSDFREATIAVHDDFALKHAFMNLYSAFIVHKNWGLLLHSSCAVESEKAHVFSGPSGAGKSTTAKLSSPRELLSDEASIIKITSEEIRVFNSPFRSELPPIKNSQPRLLRSVQLLHQAPHHKRERLKKSDAFLQLIDKVFYWQHHPDETVKIFKLLKQLVEHVPVYNLYFQKNDRFWELIS